MGFIIMISIIAALLIGGFIGGLLIILMDDRYWELSGGATFLMNCLIVILSVSLCGGGTFLIISAPKDEYGNVWVWDDFKSEKPTDIYSFEKERGVSGSSYLWYSNIKSTTYYYFYTKDEKGLLENKLANNGNVYINQTDTIPPSIVRCRDAWDIDMSYIITVPTNTIVLNWNA